MEDTIRGRSNIILTGMPGSGKSTVGVLLAKHLSFGFIDTDVLIQASIGRSLQDIVDSEGYMALRGIEEETLLALHLTGYVVATGGSAIYSEAAMAHLGVNGVIVFLNADLATLRKRIHDIRTRGLVKRPEQGLAELFEERLPLYARHADITIGCSFLSHEEVCRAVVKKLTENGVMTDLR